MRTIVKKSAVNGRLLRFRFENGVLLPFTHLVLYVFAGRSSSFIGLFWFVSREKGVPFWCLLFLLLLPRTGMEKGGQRVEAESSSASAGVVVVVQESSDAVGEETEVELGGRDVEDEEVDADEDEEAGADGFVPSPLIPLKDQLEKDKEDESLRRWKEKLLGCVEGELDGQTEPEVTFHSIGVVSEGHVDSVTSLPVAEMQNRVLFTLKEGSKYRLKLTFSVRHNIVSGLTYSNTVWKRGLKDVMHKLLQWIKIRECSVHLLLNVIHMNSCWKKRPLHSGCLPEEFTQQNLSLKMMIRDATWNSTIPSRSRNAECVCILSSRINHCEVQLHKDFILQS
ncbi:unnamed protein product [Musa banksii]